MNFLDAWNALDASGLLRSLAPLAFVALSVLLPGRGVARLAALGVALTLPLGGGAPPLRLAAWSALWLVVAWLAGRPAAGADEPRRPRSVMGLFESSAVGLAIGLALPALLVAALARADLGADPTRRTTIALLMLGLGLLHLMLRRRARRATLSFAAIGLGLQGLEDAARAAQGALAGPGGAASLALTVLAVALMDRVAAARERATGSDRVALAHDLHD